MGGLVFKNPNITTPRMPPDVYFKIKAQVLALLRQHFRYASVPVEAPAKNSYGDLDVLICEPLPGPGQLEITKPENLSVLLEARLWKRSGSAIALALPWPTPANSGTDDPSTPSVNDGSEIFGTSPPDKPTSKPAGRFIQVDVHVMPNLQSFHWMLFFHAHGDLWNILGGLIRRFGLQCNHHALHIIVPELAAQNTNKNLARVKLTDDPKKVIEYLGLDWDQFWAGFSSGEQLMAYAACCRFHNPERGKKQVRGDEHVEEADGWLRTKSNDRKRAGQRPLFAKWLDEYLPEHTDDQPGSASQMSKEEVVDDAKAFFGQAFATHYDEVKRKGMVVVGTQKLWADVRQAIGEEGAEGADLGYAMKGLKLAIQGEKFEAWAQSVIQKAARDTKDDAGSPAQCGSGADEYEEEIEMLAADDDCGIQGLAEAKKAFRELRYEDVKAWAMEGRMWGVIGARQRRLDQTLSGQRLRAKLEREEAKAIEE